MGPIWPSYFRDCTSVIVSVVKRENDASGQRTETFVVLAGSARSVHRLLILHTVKMTFTCCAIRLIPCPHWNMNVAFSYISKCFCKNYTVMSSVHGRFRQHHTDFLLLHPAAVCSLSRAAPVCLGARAVQQEVRL